ncbi:MAG: DUF4830 domain-containing protein [Oscillospiraceae bacterium]|nr:DUF4830 domain-containing protein [Oscillospiraceae bacterium]
MLVMTAKVDIKKIAIIGVAIVAVIIAVVMLFSGRSVSTAGNNAVTSNDDRVQFLASYGWEVVSSPVETSQVRIPAESSDVFNRYNSLQKSMGFDLSSYQGKTVMRYVYKIKNYPGATEPVYATLLISSNQVIGGDITDTCATGVIQGFEKAD